MKPFAAASGRAESTAPLHSGARPSRSNVRTAYMAWIQIPEENHALFRAALPNDQQIATLPMFGGLAAFVRGNMFSALFARTIMVKLMEADQQEALELDGSVPFDPMDNGRVVKDAILLSETVMDDPEALQDWVNRSFAYALTLPEKKMISAEDAAGGPSPKGKAAKAKAAKAKAAAKAATSTKAKPVKGQPAKAKVAAKVVKAPAKAKGAAAKSKPAKAAKTAAKAAKSAPAKLKGAAAKGAAKSAAKGAAKVAKGAAAKAAKGAAATRKAAKGKR